MWFDLEKENYERAYLVPIRNSLQKPIGGVGRQMPKRGRSVLAFSAVKSMLKK